MNEFEGNNENFNYININPKLRLTFKTAFDVKYWAYVSTVLTLTSIAPNGEPDFINN